jgi:hypothetical protein
MHRGMYFVAYRKVEREGALWTTEDCIQAIYTVRMWRDRCWHADTGSGVLYVKHVLQYVNGHAAHTYFIRP